MAVTPLSPIELATLAPGASNASGPDNFDETWKAEIYAESGRTVAFVKMLPKNRLIGEIVCALLGRATGLRVPKPFLVRVNRADLPQSTKWDASEKARLCFGSEDAKVLSLKRRVNVTNAAQMRSIAIWWNQLRESAAFKRMALFDEWVANHDRNLGNILWDGEPWLIDHANALTGPDWKLADLQPDTMKFTNVLLSDSYVNTLRQDVKHRWKDEATQERVKYVDIAVDTLAENGRLSDFAEPEQIPAVQKFISRRADNFVRLVCNRLGIPTLL